MRSRSERCARREEQREAAVPDGAPTEAPLAARGARKRARAACGPQAPLEALHEALREDFECSICYELLCRPTALRCGHTFCRPCLVRQRKAECAVCRAKVPAELPAVNVVLQGALQRHLAGEYAAREAVLPAGEGEDRMGEPEDESDADSEPSSGDSSGGDSDDDEVYEGSPPRRPGLGDLRALRGMLTTFGQGDQHAQGEFSPELRATEWLPLSHLSGRQVQAFARVLLPPVAAFSNIQRLDLDYCTVHEAASWAPLVAALKTGNLPALLKLSFEMSMGDEEFKMLVDALADAPPGQALPNLKSLSFHRCENLGDAGMVAFASALRASPHSVLPALESLFLGMCSYGDTGVMALFEAVGDTEGALARLRKLYMFDSRLSQRGVDAIAGFIRATPRLLPSLDLLDLRTEYNRRADYAAMERALADVGRECVRLRYLLL